MHWTQVIDPFNNIGLSALIAAIPIFILFIGLAGLRMKAHIVAILTLASAVLIAIFVHTMPANYALLSALYGSMFGLWPIGWIVISAVFLYNITVKTGQFQIIKDSIAVITNDRRLQAILIAFSFGAFLEGAAGFGTPVAITAAMLVGLGFNPLYAAGLCLIANTAPVAFGAIGIPIITAGAVSDIDAMAISQMAGRQLPILSLFVPFWLVFIMAGWKGAKEVMPAILVSGISFATVQWFSSNFLSPMLPDILSSLASIICLVLFLRVWKPKNIWRFPEEEEITTKPEKHCFFTLLKAWSPFIILTILISDWGFKSVKNLLSIHNIKIPFNMIDQMVIINDKPLTVVFNFNWLSATGTSILIAAIISAFILNIGPKQFFSIFLNTLKDLRFALITIGCVLGFAFVANWSGMTPTLGVAFTATGMFFPFISPFIGWLGVFITGSDTSSNALFCNMQKITAQSIDINPVLTVASNTTGGVAAKMISPQSIVVATSSTGLTGKEGDLLRFTLPHSILFVIIIAIIAFLQAYIFPWIIPDPIKPSPLSTNYLFEGDVILITTGFIIFLLAFITRYKKILVKQT